MPIGSHFFTKRGQLFIISEILANVKPILFKVVDLFKAPQDGFYYREQLTKTLAPKVDEYFFIEKIVKKRKVNKKEQFLVKFLYYPSKFNEWVPKENIKNYDKNYKL